ncbi:hypothetical protein EC396_02300 [Lutibacter sp. HS1-25]|uniref:hypothetical protein n=1 Tax=Lutibacter sp. HS1-25 TaxID=2485000 RepID=UPI0010101191|nr:hypothetical protein [Lutibacter sp. HS1-25]RXP63277.1 hypothetical protein EC396_02300 [Lutibacter sp. HS1-25]
MIRYLKRKNIDIVKYNACIETAVNTRIYAYSWYLDIVADNWDALVLNDYEAVMPLTWRQKYFIKYIYPPAWTQQLGVFSSFKIEADITKQFVDAIPKKFKKITIQFNSNNDLSLFKTEERMNYILPLNKSYEDIYNGYNKNRKRSLKKLGAENYSIDKKINASEFLVFYLNEQKNYQLKQDQITSLQQLLNSNQKAVNIWGIKENEKLLASLIWLKDINRITYLLPIATKKAKEKGLPTLLISQLIKDFQNSNLLLDFEGSMVKGVAGFYKSFGVEEEKYFSFKMKLLF